MAVGTCVLELHLQQEPLLQQQVLTCAQQQQCSIDIAPLQI
jgi:hypothetical protein